jgi:hypothetical protein
MCIGNYRLYYKKIVGLPSQLKGWWSGIVAVVQIIIVTIQSGVKVNKIFLKPHRSPIVPELIENPLVMKWRAAPRPIVKRVELWIGKHSNSGRSGATT